MKFFCPDWDDRVDPGYDFPTDRFSLVRDPYSDDLYGHEVLSDRIYDGLLVSRMALGEVGPKREAVERIGMRAYLRLPPDLDLFGDCGAFGYVREREPRFGAEELVDYYERLRFDFGASADHAIVPEFAVERHRRYQVTLRNAEAFLNLHRRRGCRFTPVGAIQGWDAASYAEAARALVAQGYEWLAIGGLARSRSPEILGVIDAVRAAVPSTTRLHVFGVARLSLLTRFLEFDVDSVDSSAPLRQAWLSATDNYYAPNGTYAALRIPIALQERPKPDTLVGRSDAGLARLQDAERAALAAVRAYDRGEHGLRATLTALMDYDRLLALRLDGQRADRRMQLYRRTLHDRPWRRCPCAICRELGVEVIIFRGNNRNRRRGFHNMWTVHQQLRTVQLARV